jgi:hypothetical protein
MQVVNERPSDDLKVPCPYCKGGLIVLPHVQSCERPCDFCAGTGEIYPELCTCGRPCITEFVGAKFCGREECWKKRARVMVAEPIAGPDPVVRSQITYPMGGTFWTRGGGWHDDGEVDYSRTPWLWPGD